MVSLAYSDKYANLGKFLKSKLVDRDNKVTIFDGKTAPNIDISYYINRLITGVAEGRKYEWCIVVALIYLKRIKNSGMKITEYNIHRLLLTSILLAVKYWDDNYKITEEEYLELCGLKCEEELTRLQMEFLVQIQWELFIERIDYDNMELFYMTVF